MIQPPGQIRGAAASRNQAPSRVVVAVTSAERLDEVVEVVAAAEVAVEPEAVAVAVAVAVAEAEAQ